MSAVQSLDAMVADLVTAQIADAIARAEARGEERGRQARTHLSIPEAAEALGISARHARTLVDDGTIPSVRLGTRVVVPRLALEQLGTDGLS